jgi:hypothetical protein
VVPGDGTEVWGEIHMNRGRVEEERGGKETDRCPLTGLYVGMVPKAYHRSPHVIVVDSKSHQLYTLSLQTLPYLLYFILQLL